MNHARIKYWSPDAQLEAVKQRLKHLVAPRRYIYLIVNRGLQALYSSFRAAHNQGQSTAAYIFSLAYRKV